VARCSRSGAFPQVAGVPGSEMDNPLTNKIRDVGPRTTFKSSSVRDIAYPDPVSNVFRYVHPRFQTPLPARLLVGAVAAIVAAIVPLDFLVIATGATLVSPLPHRRAIGDHRSHQSNKRTRPLQDAALAARAVGRDRRPRVRHLRAVAGQSLAGHHRRRRARSRLPLLLRLSFTHDEPATGRCPQPSTTSTLSTTRALF